MEQNNVELMRIAGITELEMAWSNIYAYYMDPRNEPEYAASVLIFNDIRATA